MSADLDTLRRWEAGGGTWEVLAAEPQRVVIALCACTGHEEMARLDSRQPDVLAFVASACERP